MFATGAKVEEERDTGDGRKFLRSFEPIRNIDDDTILAVNVISKKLPRQDVQASPDRPGETLPDAGENSVYMVDRNCRYLSINPRHLERLGITSEEIYLGKTYEDLHLPGEERGVLPDRGPGVRDRLRLPGTSTRQGISFFASLLPGKGPEKREVVAVTVVSSKSPT